MIFFYHYFKKIIFSSLLFLSLFSSISYSAIKVFLVQLDDDTINPVTADYIIQAIDAASHANAQCLVIELDTPGGLLNSTRRIVKKILTSDIPIVVYIAPNGSRAGSAGVFITYSAHIAAMAPATNIGAAHPVEIGRRPPGRKENEWRQLRRLIDELRKQNTTKKEDEKDGISEDRDDTKDNDDKMEDGDGNVMQEKILNDTVAFIKTIAGYRGRNADWAVESVVKSASITAKEAIEKGVVDLIADNLQDLLIKIDGRVINVKGKDIVLDTDRADVVKIEMSARQKFFNVLANPNIAYLLLTLGFLGLLFEVTHPGFGVPGILGIIFLILAFYSMQTLPINYAGLALLVVGIGLLFAEAHVPGFGVFGISGLVCLILGSMLLFDAADPVMRISKSVIYGISVPLGGLIFGIAYSVLRIRRMKVMGGKEGIVGAIGEAYSDIPAGGDGKVFVHGELWDAYSIQKVNKGDRIEVERIDGLKLYVTVLDKGEKVKE